MNKESWFNMEDENISSTTSNWYWTCKIVPKRSGLPNEGLQVAFTLFFYS